MNIPLPPAFSISANFSYLLRSPAEVLHKVVDQTVYKALKSEDDVFLFSATFSEQFIRVEILLAQKPDMALVKAVAFVKDWFDLETDLTTFYALAHQDPLLSRLVQDHYGYRIVGQPDLFESLCWAIIGQQINLTFAYQLKKKLVTAFGSPVVWQDHALYLFPEPASIAGANPDTLKALQFSRQKSMYIIHLAEQFASGKIRKEAIQELPFAEAYDYLRAIKGVGNWTANYVLMKTFRYPNAFPAEDAGLHNGLRKVLKREEKPSIAEVKQIFQRYAGWEAYATLYLWRA